MAGAVASGAVIVLRHFNSVGWEKFAHGEAYVLEQSTGIFRIASAALGLRDAVVVGGDQQLRISLQPHQRELAQGHIVTPIPGGV